MDKEYHKERSASFIGEGSCYIHSEMPKNKNPELVIAGDFLCMMHCINGMIDRIAYKTGTDYETTISAIYGMHHVGLESTVQMLKKAGGEYKHIEGEDWQEEWKKNKEKEIKREAQCDNLTLALNLAEMEKRNTSLNNQLVDLKKDYGKKLKAKDEDIKKLNKEILVLDHRLKEMEYQRQFPFKESENEK